MKLPNFSVVPAAALALALFGFVGPAFGIDGTNDSSTNNPISIICPSNVVQETDPNLCSAVVNYPRPSAVDTVPFSLLQVTCMPPSGSIFSVGSNRVQCVAADAFGNTNTCLFFVIIKTTDLATLQPPSDIVARAPFGQTNVVVDYPGLALTGLCVSATVSNNPPSGSSFSFGTNEVDYLVSDTSGQTATGLFHVIVVPPFSCSSLGDLVANVKNLDLSVPASKGLLKQLTAVQKAMDGGRQDVANARLGGFIRKVLQLNLRKKNGIDDVTAESLVNCAQGLRVNPS